MTPADLKIRREALGLSQEQLAGRCSVQARAVRRWETGFTPVPDFVEDVLLELEVFTDRIVAANVAEAAAQFAASPDEHIDIATFATDEALWAAHPDFLGMPASWFRQVCWRVGEQLDADVTFRFES